MIGEGASAGRVLGLVPARAGSMGLPGKNTRPLAGRPMVAWTLEACRESRVLDRVVVSTDDDAVAAVAVEMGFAPPFRRPDALSGPTASVIDAVAHALEAIGGDWDYVVLLQPTSPLRVGADIDAAVALCHSTGAPAVIGVSPVLKPQTFYGRVDQEGLYRPDSPRPDEPVVVNGAVYVGRPDSLLARRTFAGPDTRALIMPPERGWDVDTAFDFAVCEALWPHVRGEAARPLDSVRR
ncbi:MAG: acylneuraminate cytidylyltransferase family protein [Alphaproteobacteria bacterium]|nr:acylneuraminate cytidylyltransferase family protein [Alphaproteobacteria bacterium]MBU2378925.1 acylneuraminate cytidylyltransferase family protein [Alphaproteobacteria bacterium]